MKVKLSPTDSIMHLAKKASESLDADVIFYSGEIGEPSDYELIGRVGRQGKKKNCLLLVTTYGGLADSAFRMMRFLQTKYSDGKIIAFVSHFCKSAGTLMMVGADEIVMSDFAELGPLDVQVLKPDELGERTSGLTPIQALNALRAEAFNCFEQHFLLLREKSGRQITAKTAADIAVKLTVGWFQPLYEQVDPMRLGETIRAMSIAREYGMRLARGNIELEALEELISGYPQHGFIIDRDEASRLFKRVRSPKEVEIKLASALISSKLIDCGINGERAIIRVISEENCDFSDDNGWEGIEYDDQETPISPGNEPPSRKRRGRGSAAGEGDAKSTPKARRQKERAQVAGDGEPVGGNGA